MSTYAVKCSPPELHPHCVYLQIKNLWQSTVVHTNNSSYLEVEAGESKVQGQPRQMKGLEA
jgi:hypothetical protein